MDWNGMKNETVETVCDMGGDSGHRAEAAVLMRSLRVALIALSSSNES